jgi:glycosyltransferase involved in cell wall biosynthesis
VNDASTWARMGPRISVVVATRNRSDRLRALLDGMRAQTLAAGEFEVVVVDDASTDRTRATLSEEAGRADLNLAVLRSERPAGPATARDRGWRASRAAVVAFTDDDCVPHHEWLAAALRAAAEHPGSIIQGRTQPMPWEAHRAGPFSRTISVSKPDPSFQTCNVVYPRAVLERVGGFDHAAFGRSPGGEDSDLAWRAIESGADTAFAPGVLVYHAVEDLGPIGKLRVAARWTTPMLAYVRHPELRRAHFVKGLFWKGSHYHLARALLSAALPRRLRWLRPWLLGPYATELRQRMRRERASPLIAPYMVVHDVVEMCTVARAALRYRWPML